MTKQQSASMEDYLERIDMLADEDRVVRVTKLSKALGVKKPSVSSALKKLSEEGLVKHERYSYVELTPEGEKIAADVRRRHEALQRFLTEILGVDAETAWKNACAMEHCVSPITTERLAKFIDFVLNAPRGKPEWLEGFDYYLEHGKRDKSRISKCQRKET